jgi:DUF4097 and DUF4098 domain-containing protein YvlB
MLHEAQELARELLYGEIAATEEKQEIYVPEEEVGTIEPREEGEQETAWVTRSDIPDQEQVDAVVQEAEVEGEIDAQVAAESTPESTVWTDISDRFPVEDGTCDIVTTPECTQITLEKSAGDVTIQSWDQPNIRIESVEGSFAVLQAEDSLKIRSEKYITLHMPSTIGGISIVMTGTENHPSDMVVDSYATDIYIKGFGGSVSVRSIEGDITLEDCSSMAWLESESGDITVRNSPALGERLSSPSKGESETYGTAADEALKLNVKTDSGNVVLVGIDTGVDVKSSGGNIMMDRCGSQRINAESDGGSLKLRHIDSDMDLKGENSYIVVEDFFGTVKVQAKDTDISISKSGDAEIHINSDGSNISIEDCYADAYINSGVGNVRVFGGDLSFSAMGKIELKMEYGEAYLNRRTFEDVQIAIGNGNIELDTEKLNSEGSGRVSVYRGNIVLKLSPDFQCEMNAHASRKKIHLDLPVEITDEDENQVCGKLNGGGPKIDLIAPNGEIRVQASQDHGEYLQVSQSVEDHF